MSAILFDAYQPLRASAGCRGLVKLWFILPCYAYTCSSVRLCARTLDDIRQMFLKGRYRTIAAVIG
jgi:hypothetical protein